jgi:hypothetical protein
VRFTRPFASPSHSTALSPWGPALRGRTRGGRSTPNLSEAERALPNAEFLAPWFWENMQHSMPRAVYEGLSPHGQLTCRYIVADEDEALATGYRADEGGRHGAFATSAWRMTAAYEAAQPGARL